MKAYERPRGYIWLCAAQTKRVRPIEPQREPLVRCGECGGLYIDEWAMNLHAHKVHHGATRETCGIS